MINVAKNSWGKRSGLRVGGPLHKGDGCERLDLMSQPTRTAPQDKLGQSLLMGTGAGEAVQQSSDAAKDDGLPRLEGE